VDKTRRGKTEKEKVVSEFEERVVEISRVSRVVKGGRRIRFRVLVVIGNQNGKIGYGIAKGNEIATAVKKAVSSAKKRMITVPVINETIPYEVTQCLGSAQVFLKPASQGTSVVAGGVVRVMAELAGIKNLLSKTIGTSNKINNVKAVFLAFSNFDPEKVEIVRKRQNTKDSKKEILSTEKSEELESKTAEEKKAPINKKKTSSKNDGKIEREK